MNFNFKTWVKNWHLKKCFEKSPCVIKGDDHMRKFKGKKKKKPFHERRYLLNQREAGT